MDFQDKPNLTKVVRGRIRSMQQVVCFFGITGYVVTVALEQRMMVNSEWHTTICLSKVVGERVELIFIMTITLQVKQRNF